MEKRRTFQGVLNILSFNRHYYFFGLLILAALLFSQLYISWNNLMFWIIIIAFIYGLLMPLIVSAYVYDFSGYYTFNWLSPLISRPDKLKKIVNIHAGFDETSFILEKKFPGVELNVFDFYNNKKHTEPAIKRARKVGWTYPNTQTIASNSIPISEGCVDVVFLLSAVHEIRSHPEKIQFLKECLRICKPGGKIIMVEHLRDFPNFVAFSVGFTHFFSATTWKDAFKSAGFESCEETKFTPFMSVFKCDR